MNTNIKIILSILLVGGALYGAFQFGRSANTTVVENNQNATTTVATSTATTSQTTTTTKPAPKPAVVTTKPSSTNTLVKIDYKGGVCLNGKMCATTKVITKDSVYYKDGVKVSNLNKNDVSKLSSEMERVDWAALRSKPKTTGCDLQRVQEITYTFYTSKGVQVISNCQYDFDVSLVPFKTIGILLPQ